jgi:hypothetical protein
VTKATDLVGVVFGEATVLCRAPKGADSGAMWLCRCSCGAEFITSGRRLRSGKTKSCGCLRKANMSAVSRGHGLSSHPLYRRWAGMVRRCTDPKANNYKRYGGRGVTVCDRRLRSFSFFLEDMGPSWKPGLTLDRVSNDRGYEFSNCRWATPKQQGLNLRANVWVATPAGRMLVTHAAGYFGIPKTSFRRWHLDGSLPRRLGWDV